MLSFCCIFVEFCLHSFGVYSNISRKYVFAYFSFNLLKGALYPTIEYFNGMYDVRPSYLCRWRRYAQSSVRVDGERCRHPRRDRVRDRLVNLRHTVRPATDTMRLNRNASAIFGKQ